MISVLTKVPDVLQRFGAVIVSLLNPPAGYLAWLNGGTTDGLNLTDKVGALDAFEVTNRNVLSFNGTSDYIDSNISLSSDFEIIMTAIVTSSTGLSTLFGQNGNSGFWVRVNHNSSDTFQLYAGGGYIIVGGKPCPLNQWIDIRLVYVSSTTTFTLYHRLIGETSWINDGSGSRTPTFGTANLIYGQKASTDYFTGNMSFICSTGDQELPLEEGSGTKAYDVSGNGNHGTITGGTWTTADGVASAQARDGFTFADPVYIPALPDGSADALGNPITNPGGFVHNGGNYKIIATDQWVLPSVVVNDPVQGALTLSFFLLDANGYVHYRSELIGGGYAHLVVADWGPSSPLLKWIYDTSELAGGDAWEHLTLSTFPPKTGWPIGFGIGSAAITVDYDVLFVDSGEYIARSKTEILANNTDTDTVRSSYDDDGNIVDLLVYPEAPTGDDLDTLNSFLDGRHS